MTKLPRGPIAGAPSAREAARIAAACEELGRRIAKRRATFKPKARKRSAKYKSTSGDGTTPHSPFRRAW